jgi:hypothetical protein
LTAISWEGGSEMKKILSFLILLVILALMGCNLFGPNVNGTYTGPINGTQDGTPFSMDITMTLSQNGDNVTGTWSTTGGTSGTLSATITGSSFGNFIVTATNPCAGTFNGSANIMDNGDRISGSYTGNSCFGVTTASFDVNR